VALKGVMPPRIYLLNYPFPDLACEYLAVGQEVSKERFLRRL